ncbi:TPA: hypothetical protein QHK25_000163 [Klebsiella quasipneumoniae subsp. similipneumoniae]|nr:hypothetical protein [Klebsiella pneumoniae]HDT5741929.1 hypothetical protein [Klebsiella quasipneumoniae subsp. similipneumoniae]
MSAMEKWDDDTFIQAMSEVMPEQEMTHELAAQEAIADFKTEQQASLMRGIYEQ